MSFLKRSLMSLASSQLRPICTGRMLRSDALFVHRDKDPDVKHFEFNNENLKVTLKFRWAESIFI